MPANGDAIGIMSSGASTGLVFGTSATAARTDTPQHWQAPQVMDPIALSIVSGHITPDANTRNTFTVSLTANATLDVPLNLSPMQPIQIWVTNTGAFSVTFAAGWHYRVNDSLVVQQGAGKKTLVTGVVDPTGTYVLAAASQEN